MLVSVYTSKILKLCYVSLKNIAVLSVMLQETFKQTFRNVTNFYDQLWENNGSMEYQNS